MSVWPSYGCAARSETFDPAKLTLQGKPGETYKIYLYKESAPVGCS